MHIQDLFDESFLRAQWHAEFMQFQETPDAADLHQRLKAWSGRELLNERESETAFIQRFFVEIWGYSLQGHAASPDTYTCRPQFQIAGAGQRGGAGFADLALGNFGSDAAAIPQVLCEFKDIRSGLDAPQARKGSNRSPVEQCLDYLNEAWQRRQRDALVEPAWAIVTDMNEFRLYSRLRRGQFQRFVISGGGSALASDLCADNDTAAFRRFIFWRMFRPDMLLSGGGPCALARLLQDQVTREKDIEKTFYREYSAYRKFVYECIVESNPDFKGTRGKLVRLTQRFLDRCIFVLFCEDMGRELRYPPELLRDMLIEHSLSRHYNPNGAAPWNEMREIFRAMRDGGEYGPHTIDRFNGGLFEPDPDLDNLRIPAKVFCAQGQGTAILQHPRTLLYFSGAYNFGLSSASGERTIGLTTLGRIFEQSITELEIMEADADGRVSINRLTKRKTDGVYYTPEWVTRYIVEHTIGARLADIRTALGADDLKPLDDAAIAAYRAFQKDGRRSAPVAGAHREFLRRYREKLDRLRIVDPACGSGAFLIQALDYLLAEYRHVVEQQQRIDGHAQLFDQDSLIRSILSNNIYGVDLNPESVEITKLALWLHTASPGRPLCALDSNIRCGNSLVGEDFAEFYRAKHATLFDEVDENERERINAFDWRSAFPTVFAHGGFDCVIGNPPYVKLQHFRKAQPDVSEYLTAAVRADGKPLYESTRTGNFDMYLPFIEKGIELLRPDGRMGYIAPNVWMVNEYGAALRGKLKRIRALDRWIDFKSFQVFDEAITYTALQFFRGTASKELACAFAPDGNIAAVNWQTADRIQYDNLPDDEAWNLAPAAEMRLMEKLQAKCKSLINCCKGIAVGIQTSADEIYHLKRISQNRYVTRTGTPIEIEDTIMHPLVSGPEAKRYQEPKTDTYLLFPYVVDGGTRSVASAAKPRLYTEAEMADRYPLAWAYLRKHETTLRGRERGKMDDEYWFRFGRNQNIDKQHLPKLMVPRLITRLFCSIDFGGTYYLDNVDVGGILCTEAADLPFLAGIINAPVCNFVWRRISKPFQNDYRSANKQFIAPLPIPDTSDEDRKAVADAACRLQELHTQRRDLVAALDERLNSAQTQETKPALKPDWLWADVGTPATWKTRRGAPVPWGTPSDAPGKKLTGRELTAWAKARYQTALETRLAGLDALLRPGATLSVTNDDSVLTLTIDGIEALRLYDKPDTPFIAAQWRHTLRDANVTESYDAKRLLRFLLTLRTTADNGLRDRIIALDREITALDKTIAAEESTLNTIIYRLYNLEPDEIRMVEAG